MFKTIAKSSWCFPVCPILNSGATTLSLLALVVHFNDGLDKTQLFRILTQSPLLFSTRFNEIATHTHTPRARDAHHIKQEEVVVLVQPISALPCVTIVQRVHRAVSRPHTY